MAAEKSYARLGFFIVVALIVVLATAVLFIQRLRTRESIKMATYTVENVSGLDVSSPVRYRGVPVGRVTSIGVEVDPNGTRSVIEIDFEVFLDRLTTVGFDLHRIRRIADIQKTFDAQKVFPRLRAQVVGNPVTGEAYLLLDSPQNPPPSIELGFTPNRSYVPMTPSPFSTVQERLPEILDRAQTTLQTLDHIVARIPDSLDRSDRFFTTVERIVQKSDLPALSTDSRKFFTTTSAHMEQMRFDMDKFSDETRAAIKAADFPSATQAARDAAENSKLASDDLRRSLPAIRESLDQMRELSRQLQEQPESVVYGPRPPKAKH